MKQTEEIDIVKDFGSTARGQFKCRVYNNDMSLAYEDPSWSNNLILDSGLDKIPHMAWAQTFQFCVAGTASNPTKVFPTDNTKVSFSGGSASLSGGSFTFTSTGSLIYCSSSGIQAKIISTSSATQALTDFTSSVATQSFGIYNVQQTNLFGPYSMNMMYDTGSGLCGTTISGSTVSMYRTFIFYMENTPVTYTELGFLESPAASTLFSRVILPTPLSLSAGQFLTVSYQLNVTLTPNVATPKITTITGWPILPSITTDGTESLQRYGISIINSEGVAVPYDQGGLCNEPYAPGSRFLGPYYGYTNRWKNSTSASPIKIYGSNASNPFINPRYYKLNYEGTLSKNYAAHCAAGTSATPSPNLWAQGPGGSIFSSTISDLMVPVIPPAAYQHNPGTGLPTWNGVDPLTVFPNAIPYVGETTWADWTGSNAAPVAGASSFISVNSASVDTFSSSIDRSAICWEVPLVRMPYTASSATVIKKGTFLTNIANGTSWRSIGIGPTDPGYSLYGRVSAASSSGYVLVFDQPQTKTNLYALNAFFQYTWGRDLSHDQ
jgi:hypothetical protein